MIRIGILPSPLLHPLLKLMGLEWDTLLKHSLRSSFGVVTNFLGKNDRMILNSGFQDLYYWDFIIPHSSGFFHTTFGHCHQQAKILCLSLACAHANKPLKREKLELILWEHTLEKVACIIHSLDNMFLNSGFSSLNLLFKAFSFCFSLLSLVKKTPTII